MLPVYDPVTNTRKTYVAARDRVLRESPEPDSTPLPPFRIMEERKQPYRLNVFLVALNAEIKFRRYFEMVRRDPPPLPLPDHVLHLMHRTTELIDLVYWEPVPTKGSHGEEALAQRIARRRQNPGRYASNTVVGKDTLTLSGGRAARKAYRPPWPEDADLETRMAIGRAMMCGHGLYLFSFILRSLNMSFPRP